MSFLIDVFKGKEVPNIINQNPFNLKYDLSEILGSSLWLIIYIPNEVHWRVVM